MPVRQYENSILYAVRAKNGDEEVGVTTNLTQRRALIKRGGSSHKDFIVAHGGFANVVVVPLRKVNASDPITQSLEKEKFITEKRANIVRGVEPTRESVFATPHRREVSVHVRKPREPQKDQFVQPVQEELLPEKRRCRKKAV